MQFTEFRGKDLAVTMDDFCVPAVRNHVLTHSINQSINQSITHSRTHSNRWSGSGLMLAPGSVQSLFVRFRLPINMSTQTQDHNKFKVVREVDVPNFMYFPEVRGRVGNESTK